MTFKFFNLLNRSISFNLLLWSSIFYCLNNGDRLQAQVLEDGTLSTEVTTDNNSDFTVNAGEQRGNNLFHSFAEFSIPNNGLVSFNNGLSIQNIITRVTGSSISNINGLIQSNGTANLFLINPNGIIFGENASLNIGGSFVGTTAESLVFADNTEFSTSLDSQEALLTVSVPLGLQFGSNPGEIVNRANFSIPNPLDPTGQDQIKLGLTTPPEKTLALLGGDITFDGGAVSAAVGNVELGSVGENSFVALESIAEGWKANYDNISQFRNIKLDNSASIDASGEGGGGINVQGQNIQILNGSTILSNTFGAVNGQDITIGGLNAVEIDGSDPTNQKLDPNFIAFGIFVPLSSRVISGTFGEGNGGNIRITAQEFSLTRGSKIQTQTISTVESSTLQLGNSGDILINSNNSIDIGGLRPLLGVADNAEELFQNLFSISLEALEFIDLNRAITSGQGSSIDSISSSNGNSGNININTDKLTIEDASSISNSPTPFSTGTGGNINITSSQSVEISGSSELNSSFVSIISANTFGEGDAGTISLNTEELLLKNGGGITTGTLGLGNGGELDIEASSITITGTSGDGVIKSGFGSEAFSIGNAGDVSVNTESLTITDRSQITVRGLNSGIPGNLIINANSARLSNNAQITAENTAAFDGGNIELNIVDSLTLENNSSISAQAFGDANGGNITISGGFLIANPNENNDILTTAVRGDGGNITIVGEGIFGITEGASKPPNSINNIDASSEFGADGTVNFNFPEIKDSDFETKTSFNAIKVESLLGNSLCRVGLGSKYYFTGKKGIELSPDRDLDIQDGWSDFRFFDPETIQEKETEEVETSSPVEKLETVKGWFEDSNGQLILTAKSVEVASHSSELPHPGCNINNQ